MFKYWFESFVIAVMFLTRFPMPTLSTINADSNRNATLLFPAIGLLIGTLITLTVFFGQLLLPPNVVAAGVLIVWVFTTGGLHIDGLADSADAWLGGLGDKSRSLAIMKDPRCGSGALAAVICLLIAKYACLVYLMEQAQVGQSQNPLEPVTPIMLALLLLPMLGRMASLLLFRSTPYVREGGSANSFLEGLSPKKINGVLGVYALIAVIGLGGNLAAIILLCCGLSFFLLRRMMVQRLGGTTGDTAGATVELIELTALFALCGYY